MSVVECSDETPAQSFLFHLLAALFKVGIKRRQVLPEVFECTFEVGVGYEEVLEEPAFA